MARSRRNQSLDILRGIAIVLVLGVHYQWHIWGGFGATGVDLFFVLSGYLISGLLFSEYKRFGNIDLPRFWIRRGFKIYPMFYFLIAFTAAYYLATARYVPESLLHDALFVQNYLPGIWPQGWSIAVEEHFYFTLPILLAAMIRLSGKKRDPFAAVPWAFLVVGSCCLVLRIVEIQHGVSPVDILVQTHLRIDSLFAGVALGYYRHFRPEVFDVAARRLGAPAGIAFLLAALVFPFPGTSPLHSLRFTAVYLGYAGIVAWAVRQPPSERYAARALAWVGRYSYGIYLWHGVFVVSILDTRPSVPFLVLYAAGSIGLGAGVSWLIEVPGLRLRDRVFPSRSGSLPAVTTNDNDGSLSSG